MPHDLSGIGGWLCLGGTAIGALTLIGWISGTPNLTTIIPSLPPMMPNTAVGMMLIGVAGVLRRREGRIRRAISILLSLFVLALGIATLAQYAFDTSLDIDQLLVRVPVEARSGRPSPPTAFAFTCLGAALLCFDFRLHARARPSEWLIVNATVIGFAALMGHVFGAEELYRLAGGSVIGVSFPTAIALLLISAGLLLERAEGGLMRLATSGGPGGMLIRRLIPAAILGPAILGYIDTQLLEQLGVAHPALEIATLITASTAIALALVAVTAAPLDRMHDALEASRARTLAFLEHAGEGIFVADLDGRYTEVNDAGCRMLGRSRAELVGKTIVDLIPVEQVEQLGREKEQLLEGGCRISEWKLLRKDGTYLPVEVSAKILPDGRWQGFVRDISERQRREREQRLLADAGSILISTLDFDEMLSRIGELIVRDLADFFVVVVPEAGELRRAKVVSRDPAVVLAYESVIETPLDPARPHLVRTALETRRPVLMPHLSPEDVAAFAQSEEHLRALRTVDARSAVTAPLLVHGKLLGAIGLISSTPSREYGTADLRLVDELARLIALSMENAQLYGVARRAIQARDDVLGVVAHDLRNPLGAILMQLALLRRRGDEPERRSRRPLETIERAATRMNRLIQDLLDVTRMEAGRLSIEQARMPAGQLIAEAQEAQSPLVSGASLALSVEVPDHLPEVWADRDRLLQVFENLIGNAVKFTGTGGRITLGVSPRRNDVLFWVADTGPGIDAEDLPHVFDRFWQRRKGEGAGLGLPIVKGIVDAHRGRIWIESTSRGSTIFFTIPLADRIEQARNGERAP